MSHPAPRVPLRGAFSPPGPFSVSRGSAPYRLVRLYLRVAGPTAPAPAPAVEDLRASGTGVSYTLHNLGNVTLRPRAALSASGALGRRLLWP
ncbi:hypothetical protein [Streptomyces sp. NBC_00354]|uniref:hypothetical protein n=1 Tax=Streptomyces sp. NBC_00354 TaxID=2975723 RepID=UPI002E26FDF6